MNKKSNTGYATVTEQDGVDYREIACVMTDIGFPMNHSSARNHFLRAMTKLAESYAKALGVSLNETQLSTVARSPSFQQSIGSILEKLDDQPEA